MRAQRDRYLSATALPSAALFEMPQLLLLCWKPSSQSRNRLNFSSKLDTMRARGEQNGDSVVPASPAPTSPVINDAKNNTGPMMSSLISALTPLDFSSSQVSLAASQ
jgi:hypothetical protein